MLLSVITLLLATITSLRYALTLVVITLWLLAVFATHSE
jgi:hypothetical protein